MTTGRAFAHSIRNYALDAARAFDRAPVEVALALCTAAFFSYALETNVDDPVVFTFAVAAVLAGCAAWSATIGHALGAWSARARWGITLAGAAASIAYLLSTPTVFHEADPWRALLLLAGGLLIMLAAPAWAGTRAEADLRMRRIDGRLILRGIGIVLYGLALFGGLALALFAVDNLFDVGFKGKIYGHVFIWIMMALVPWTIFGGLNEYVAPLDEQSDVARVVHRLTAYLVPPLAAIYFLILLAYVVRIAITRELPQNLVSPMVIAAGLLSALALILFDPDVDARPTLRWLRYTPLVLLLLAPLGLWAIFMRVGDYGWTEFRLLRVILLVVLLILAVWGAVELVRRRHFSLRVIPTLLGVVLLIAAIGPWSVLSVARRDQENRLRTALQRAGITNGHAPTPRVISGALYQQINSAESFLRQHFGDEVVARVIPSAPASRPREGSLADYLHLVPSQRDTLPHFATHRLQQGSGVLMPSGEVVQRIELHGNRSGAVSEVVGDTLHLLVNGDTLLAGIQPLMTGFSGTSPRGGPKGAITSALPLFNNRGEEKGRLIVLDATLRELKGKRDVTNLDGLLILRPR